MAYDFKDLIAKQANQFELTKENFSPQQVLDWIVGLFKPQGLLQNTVITLESKPLKLEYERSFSRILPSPYSIDSKQDGGSNED